jgi:hypothetical protein
MSVNITKKSEHEKKSEKTRSCRDIQLDPGVEKLADAFSGSQLNYFSAMRGFVATRTQMYF